MFYKASWWYSPLATGNVSKFINDVCLPKCSTDLLKLTIT